MVKITKTMVNGNLMACKRHATKTPLTIRRRSLTKTSGCQTSPGYFNSPLQMNYRFFYANVMFVTFLLMAVFKAAGAEPEKQIASSSVSATVIRMDQMAEIGTGTLYTVQSNEGYSNHMSDTLLPSRHVHIVTLNCE